MSDATRKTRSDRDPVFQWTAKRRDAALALAQGKTQREAAQCAEVTDRTIYAWLNHPDFAEEVDRLTLVTSIAARAERLRIAMRVARQKVKDDGTVDTKADLLEWLKFAQSETTGAVNDLADKIADAVAIRQPDRPTD